MDVTINQSAEGKTFDFLPESAIRTNELKTFEFSSPEQLIIIENKEFSAVCPFSGLPDVAYLKIEYFPDGGRGIELKSLKYYITSFRNVGIYQEAVTKRIRRDLESALLTIVKVTTKYNTRGGFDTTCIEGQI